MNVFQASDIVEIAIRIEENGADFYRYAVQIARDEQTKNLFSALAEDELGHEKVFRKIFATMDKSNPPETYDGEYAGYLHDYVDNKLIFTKQAIDQELAKIKDTNAALEFAIRRELDSITYYQEIKRFVDPAQHVTIDAVIAEERKHFVRLSETQRKLSA
ncbi:MAG: ferritin family protein [Smithellaceae bacterium]|nr:ferritin family protein [Smithellaceae bacterium]